MDRSKSKELFEKAKLSIPGGVNSPVRSFSSVGGYPAFIRKGTGPYIEDIDGNRFIDLVCSWGPLVLGHANEEVLSRVGEVMTSGLSFGAPTELEVELAELVCSIVPGVEMLRTTSSGTEATMSAIRLARGATGRDLIVKCDGCYHGHADSLLVKSGSGLATLGIAGSPGVTAATASQTISIPFNDLSAFEQAISEHGADKIACLIIEPVAGNMGFVKPENGYLEGLRALCTKHGIVLIFDEVMSGFRVSLGGASEYYKVEADLVTLGKVLGGGMPVGAFGGRKDLMSHMAPLGSVYQAGTLSGNPLACAAGLATLGALVEAKPYQELGRMTSLITTGLSDLAKKSNLPFYADSLGSMFGFFFSSKKVTSYQDAASSDVEMFKKFFWAMFEEGVYLAPSSFEAGFISTCHTEDIVDEILGKAGKVFYSMAL